MKTNKMNLLQTTIKLFQSTSHRLIAIAMLSAMFISVLPFNKVSAAGTISGTVYIDYNMNGVRETSGTAPNYAVDSGVSGVLITAYDASGSVRGTATSAATTGIYSLVATGTGPYRLEFTNLPSGYYPSAVGSNNSSAVRFVNDGNSTSNDFGIVSTKEYCQNNPLLSTTCYINGDNTTAADALVGLKYDRTGSVQHIGFTNEIGSTFGLAWKKRSKRLFVSSLLKRHSALGPGKDGIRGNADDMRTIYVYDYSNPNPANGAGTIVTAEAIDLGAFGVNLGANPRIGSTPANDLGGITAPSRDYGVFDKVGKVGIGGIALSEDENTLYVVNLNSAQPQLVSLNVSNLSSVSLNSTVNIPNPGCPGTDLAAPWAVRVNQGNVYVGTVCSANVSQSYSNMRAYLLRLNGSSFTTVDLDSTTANDYISLNYDRTFGYAGANGGSGGRAEWRPWLTSFPTNLVTTYEKTYATPIFSDMEFQKDGSLSIGIMDRSGHQIGYGNYSENQSSTTLYDYISSGDVLKICNSGGNFIPEGKAGCSQPTGGIYDRPDGSGGTPTEINGLPNEFYNDSSLTGGAGSDGHLETFFGGMGAIPGVNELAIVQMNPGATYHAGGLRWMNTTNGSAIANYTLYQNPNSTSQGATFGKSNGLGDIQMLCDAAPLQVGNRIWNDANGNGVQDPGESPIAGVAVEIWADTTGNGTPDTRVGTATTDSTGNYLFGGINNTNLSTYSCGAPNSRTIDVRVDRSADDAEQPASPGSVILDSTDLDFFGDSNGGGTAYPDLGVRFNNLSIPQGATITNAYIELTGNNSNSVSSGNPTITIQGENVGNAATFTTAANNISSRTWLTGQNVTWNPSSWTRDIAYQSPSLTNVVQSIVNRGDWASDNSMAFRFSGTSTTSSYREAESFDGDSADAPLLHIEFSFTPTCSREVNPNTAYEVRIPTSNFSGPLSGLVPTIANNGGATNGTARDSDGIVLTGSQVIAPFTTGVNGQNNHSYDFGFRAGANAYSVGNRIWYDTNNDGIINAGEVGISGVSVSIFLDADGNGVPDTVGSPISTKDTDANGYYRFDGLAANKYVIRVNPINYQTGGKLRGYSNTANSATPTDDGRDSFGSASDAENGVNAAGAANNVLSNGVLSNSFMLSGVLEPQNEPDVPSSGTYAGQGSLDNQADMTVDFGFYKLTLSGTAWSDTGLGLGQIDNGILDAGESRLIGYRTRLYDSANVEIPVGPDGILGTSDDAVGGMYTNLSGDYNFMGMLAGDYRVVIISHGGVSSTPTENDPNLNGDNNDNGFPDNTGNYPGMLISGIVNLRGGVVAGKTNNVVTNANGSTTDPTVDFGILLSPTLVKMDKLGAYFDGQNVVVEWSTGDEIGNIGFNVYRETNGQKELLTDAPVAGSALKTAIDLKVKGDSYRWIDKESKYGGSYYIEDLDIDGNRTMHGPVQPSIKFGFDGYNSVSSKLISDLATIEDRSTQKEFIGELPDVDADNSFSTDSSVNLDKQREIAAMEGGVRLSVKKAGWYRVSMNQLAQSGFDVSSNNDLWQLFANGTEVPLQISYNRLNNSYSVEFYGTGVETNITDEQVYYLVEGNEAGMRLPERKGGQIDGVASALNYEVTAQRKDRLFYLSSLLNGENENWFGPIVFPTSQTVQTLTVRDPFNDGTNQAILKVRLQGLTDVAHLVNVRFNDLDLGVVEYYGKGNREFEFNVPMSALYSDTNAITLQSVGATNDLSLVDTVSLRYSRGYMADNGQIHFSVPANQTARVGGFNNSGIKVIEIGSDGNAVGQTGISEEKVNGKVGFSLAVANYDREFLAVDPREFSIAVSKIEENNPSTWNRRENRADFIIIAPNLLSKEADQLAEIRQTQGLNTVVVMVEDIYDEYSYGLRSNEAIRSFLKDASSEWELKPRFVLLFGDSSADHRNYLNQEDRDLIPTKLIDTQFSETSSDGWLADFDNDGIEDMSIGRLPVGNTVEARKMLAKLLRFDQQETRPQNTNLLVADNLFTSYNDLLESRLPANAGAIRINRSQMSDSQMRSDIISSMQLNPLVVTYTGHGSTGVWASANVLRDTDVASFANEKLAFFMLMTCLNGYTHSPTNESLAEVFVKTENGAIAVWASSGSTYASGQILMSQQATVNLFNLSNNPLSIGEITRSAKLTTTDLDARRTWQLIGDPTLVLK